MIIETRFPSREAMEQVVAMGMEEGRSGSMGPDQRHPCRRLSVPAKSPTPIGQNRSKYSWCSQSVTAATKRRHSLCFSATR